MRTFFKTIPKYKISSIHNILGLAAAFTVFYIILVQVNYDFTYNSSIKFADRIYLLFIADEELFGGYSAWI